MRILILVLLLLALSGCSMGYIREHEFRYNRSYCEQDSDCVATCAFGGCPNKYYAEGLRDCAQPIVHTCECKSYVCTRVPGPAW